MRSERTAARVGLVLLAVAMLAPPPLAPGQTRDQIRPEAAPGNPANSHGQEAIQAIDEEYNRQLLQIETRRLTALAQLADSQKPPEAASTYERYFRLAIAADLFREAETVAGKVVKQGTSSPTTDALAHLVKIIAQADRRAFEDSLESLRQAVAESTQDRPATAIRAALAPDEVIGICEAYYQRLVEANQFAIARKAFRLVLDQPYSPVLKDFVANRLKRLELVGGAAPPIRGTDLDGKPFDLSSHKGKAVLLHFWATWSLPAASQIAWLEQVQETYRKRGLDVVGINLDAHGDGGPNVDAALAGVRRFLLDYNVPWPTLMSGSGDLDFAKPYGVADIPANVLIGRDGTVVQVDLSRRNVDSVVTRVLGP